MNISKKIIILFIFILAFYIIFRFIQKRMKLFNIIEGYESSRVKSLEKKNPNIIAIGNFTTDNLTKRNGISDISEALKLKHYLVKSSYNTAFNGSSIDLEMIKYVLSRGCRFIDFEVFWSVPTESATGNPQAVVSMSDDPFSPSNNSILLNDVFKTIMLEAFNSSSPNPDDPLFIQIRPKVSNKKNEQMELFNKIASSILFYFGNINNSNVLFNGAVNKNTNISDIMGKVIIVFDNTAYPMYSHNSPELKNIVHLETMSDSMMLYNHSTFNMTNTTEDNNISDLNTTPTPDSSQITLSSKYPIYKLSVNPDEYTTNIKVINEVLPIMIDNGNAYSMMENTEFKNMVFYGAQIIPMEFWSNDKYLKFYEEMFNDYGSETNLIGSAFIPFTSAMSYLNMHAY